MQKTVVVAIDIRKRHPIYKKVVRVTKKVYAHDESDAIKVGSIVQLVESKPLSKTKRWVVEKVVEDVGNKVIQPIAGEVTIEDTSETASENEEE
jgi:small subunit ribosomal protein S17